MLIPPPESGILCKNRSIPWDSTPRLDSSRWQDHAANVSCLPTTHDASNLDSESHAQVVSQEAGHVGVRFPSGDQGGAHQPGPMVVVWRIDDISGSSGVLLLVGRGFSSLAFVFGVLVFCILLRVTLNNEVPACSSSFPFETALYLKCRVK